MSSRRDRRGSQSRPVGRVLARWIRLVGCLIAMSWCAPVAIAGSDGVDLATKALDAALRFAGVRNPARFVPELVAEANGKVTGLHAITVSETDSLGRVFVAQQRPGDVVALRLKLPRSLVDDTADAHESDVQSVAVATASVRLGMSAIEILLGLPDELPRDVERVRLSSSPSRERVHVVWRSADASTGQVLEGSGIWSRVRAYAIRWVLNDLKWETDGSQHRTGARVVEHPEFRSAVHRFLGGLRRSDAGRIERSSLISAVFFWGDDTLVADLRQDTLRENDSRERVAKELSRILAELRDNAALWNDPSRTRVAGFLCGDRALLIRSHRLHFERDPEGYVLALVARFQEWARGAASDVNVVRSLMSRAPAVARASAVEAVPTSEYARAAFILRTVLGGKLTSPEIAALAPLLRDPDWGRQTNDAESESIRVVLAQLLSPK